MKKLFLVIGLALGGYAIGSAQTAATTNANSDNTAPKAACCQKGAEAKACCAKNAKVSEGSKCSGHEHKTQSAENAAAPAGSGNAGKSKEKAKTTK